MYKHRWWWRKRNWNSKCYILHICIITERVLERYRVLVRNLAGFKQFRREKEKKKKRRKMACSRIIIVYYYYFAARNIVLLFYIDKTRHGLAGRQNAGELTPAPPTTETAVFPVRRSVINLIIYTTFTLPVCRPLRTTVYPIRVLFQSATPPPDRDRTPFYILPTPSPYMYIYIYPCIYYYIMHGVTVTRIQGGSSIAN